MEYDYDSDAYYKRSKSSLLFGTIYNQYSFSGESQLISILPAINSLSNLELSLKEILKAKLDFLMID